MSKIIKRDVVYEDEGRRLFGYFCIPAEAQEARPGILLIHDAFGIGDYIRGRAERLAALGYAVLAADVWGDGATLGDEGTIRATIGRFAGDRAMWFGRLRAGYDALVAQPGVDPTRTAAVGYCFGGASVLEFARLGGSVRGVVSFHGGLDLVGAEWSAGKTVAKVLITTGFEDPLAPQATLRKLETAMSEAGIDWEVDCYSHTRHAFTRVDAATTGRPEMVAYDERADRRSWRAMIDFLDEVLGR